MHIPKVPTNAKRHELRAYPENQNPVMYQSWEHILFLNWEFNIETIQEKLPPGLHVDTYNGFAYVSIVPFIMKKARPRRLPNMRVLSNFMELTFRTYVYDSEGNPGVWFFSLDVNNLFAFNTGKRLFKLPYKRATMRNDIDNKGTVDFISLRKNAGDEYILRYTYEADGKQYFAEPDSLAFFLIERYIFFSYINGKLYRTRVYHEPYPLRDTLVNEYDDRIFKQEKMPAPTFNPSPVMMSCDAAVQIFRPEKVNVQFS